MSSAANTAPPPTAVVQPPPSPSIPWVPLAWFFTLLVVCYAPVLRQLIHQWSNDDDMGHGFFVPVIAVYIAWLNREKLLASGWHTNYWGLALVIFAGLQLIVATFAAELFTQRTAFVEAVIGAVLFLGGTAAVRILAFPLVLLFFMVPIPAVIYSQITFPLQIFASQVAEFLLNLMGYAVLREGNVLELASQKLSVVDACSGIRSLLSLTFLSLVSAYFFDTRVWMRAVLFVAVIPIAIAANAGRVTLTGVLSEINPEYSRGMFHEASGWVIFMIALFLLVAFHQLLNRILKPAPHATN
jgi:exosortase